jgi:hypothetical protein
VESTFQKGFRNKCKNIYILEFNVEKDSGIFFVENLKKKKIILLRLLYGIYFY